MIQTDPTDIEYYKKFIYNAKYQAVGNKYKEFNELKIDLENLQLDIAELNSAIGKYNTDPFLIVQLAKIENYKSEIIKKMASKL